MKYINNYYKKLNSIFKFEINSILIIFSLVIGTSFINFIIPTIVLISSILYLIFNKAYKYLSNQQISWHHFLDYLFFFFSIILILPILFIMFQFLINNEDFILDSYILKMKVYLSETRIKFFNFINKLKTFDQLYNSKFLLKW